MIEHRAHENGEWRFDCDGCNPVRRLRYEHEVWQSGYAAAMKDLTAEGISFEAMVEKRTPNPYPKPKSG